MINNSNTLLRRGREIPNPMLNRYSRLVSLLSMILIAVFSCPTILARDDIKLRKKSSVNHDKLWFQLLAISPDDRSLAVFGTTIDGGKNKDRHDILRIFDMETKKVIVHRKFPKDTFDLYRMAGKFTTDGKLFMVNDKSGALVYLKPDTLETVRTIPPKLYVEPADSKMELRSWDLSHNGMLLAIGINFFYPSRSKLKLLNLNNESVLYEFADDQNHLYDVAFSPDGHFIASYSSNNIVVREAKTGKQLHRLTYDVSGIQFSPDSKLLVAWVSGVEFGRDKLMIWDMATNKLVREITDKRNGVRFPVDFSPNGKWLLANVTVDRVVAFTEAGHGLPWWERKFKIWELKSGKQVYETPLSTDRGTRFLRFSRDSKYIFRDAGEFEVYEIIEK